MEHSSGKRQRQLIIKPKGRLDTKTAPVLADKLYEILGDTKELILAFSCWNTLHPPVCASCLQCSGKWMNGTVP